jgi:hypothetical protein
VTVALGVKDAELGAGVRPLAAHDQPRALGPARKVDLAGELSDLGALTLGPLRVDRLLPCRLGQVENRPADPLVDLAADREANGGVATVGGEGVGSPADVCADEDLALEICRGQLLDASCRISK